MSDRLIRSRRHRALGRLRRDSLLAWLLLVPLLAVVAVMIAYPFGVGVLLSFEQQVVGGSPTWVGLANYAQLLVGQAYSDTFHQSIVVSFLYTAVSVAAKFVLGLAMAVILNERFPGRGAMRTILFLPWALPTIIVGLAWRWIYDGTPDGVINHILLTYFHHTDLVQFLADPSIALWSVIAVVVWQGTPFYTMMFLAGMQAIPGDQYEAARIDGARTAQRFLHITLPSLKPAILITTLLSTIWTANSINFVYVLTQGGPLNATMTFPMLAYQIGIGGGRDLGLSAAVSVFFFPVFVVAIFFLTRRMLVGSTK